MSLFATAWPVINDWMSKFPGRVSLSVSNNSAPLTQAPIALENEELKRENISLRQRLHRTKQHNSALTRQIEEAQKLTRTAQAEAEYWHARCTKQAKELEDAQRQSSSLLLLKGKQD